MNPQEIQTRVIEILINKLRISKTEIRLESTLTDLGADSLEQMEIILKIEQEFGITISDDFKTEVQNLRNICKYIENRILLHPTE